MLKKQTHKSDACYSQSFIWKVQYGLCGAHNRPHQGTDWVVSTELQQNIMCRRLTLAKNHKIIHHQLTYAVISSRNHWVTCVKCSFRQITINFEIFGPFTMMQYLCLEAVPICCFQKAHGEYYWTIMDKSWNGTMNFINSPILSCAMRLEEKNKLVFYFEEIKFHCFDSVLYYVINCITFYSNFLPWKTLILENPDSLDG